MRSVAGIIVFTGAMSAALAVALGAFGAHALVGRIPDDMLGVYETASRYHFYHSLGLLVVGMLAAIEGMRAMGEQGVAGARAPRPIFVLGGLRWAAVLMLTGIVLFSGSLYTMALTGQRWLGAVTPLGGVAFLAAWALLAWSTLRGTAGAGR